MKFASIDFEYSNTTEENVKPICAVIRCNHIEAYGEYWFNDPKDLNQFVFDMRTLAYDKVNFLSFSAMAEARALLALGVNPLDLNFIDLYVEYLQLANHNNKVKYGKHLIDGKIKTTFPKKTSYGTNTNVDSSKPEFSLSSACFKFLNIFIDTEEKEAVRAICIRGDIKELEVNRERILKYCASDVEYLYPLYLAMMKKYEELPVDQSTLHEEQLYRARYACLTAKIESNGYPIDVQATRNFTDAVPSMIAGCQKDINSQFPENPPFRFNKKDLTYSWNQKSTREWIDKLPQSVHSKWDMTEGGEEGLNKQYSLSLEAFEKFYNFNQSYPRFNYGAQIVRYLKLLQHLNGFKPKKKNSTKKTFWDSVGSDGRSRPFLGIYGSQSARNQPSSTGFLFLKSAWMRSLCVPKEGNVIVALDFSQQEFLIAALLSQDEAMIDAYRSGDTYLYFAKLAGAVPWDGKKSDHVKVRDLFKGTVLMMQFGGGAQALALKLTNDTGRYVSEMEASGLISKFEKSFPKYIRWKERQYEIYRKQKYLKLKCGWYLLGDNFNKRSIMNFPVQGFGSSVLRKSVESATLSGLKIILTLHDALYIECPIDDIYGSIERLARSMQLSFSSCFSDNIEHFVDIRLDGKCWGPGLIDSKQIVQGIPISFSEIMIDERGVDEYNYFKQYFISRGNKAL